MTIRINNNFMKDKKDNTQMKLAVSWKNFTPLF